MLTISFVLILTCSTIFTIFPAKAQELKTYIVHLNSPQAQEFSQTHYLEEWYNSFLSGIASTSNEKPTMVHAYHHVITGFAAKMSAEQAKAMGNMSGVVSVRPESVLQLHTTRSRHFLRLHDNSGLWKDSNHGKGIIIGILDTGITPGHPSFNDKGVPPPPTRWKGKCQVAGCNNKLIGMRTFVSSSSPVDQLGHGTHTSSIAAGNFVDNANIFGHANGTATGMAPLAHVAMYKVCGTRYCSDSDTIAGMDAAIGDGVDMLSISLGRRSVPFYRDSLAIGTFTAIQKGIFVSCSAGNCGPFKARLSNVGPWILTVGASNLDRKIRTTVNLGNDKLLNGESLYQPKNSHQKLMPLVYPGEKGDYRAATCRRGSLDATILLRGTILGIKSAPEVTCFSSRGPNLASPGILKPDIIGPGVDILAAWPKSVENKPGTKATFNLLSGTSMSCPHLTGIAALLKSAHPEWSPAAIKSAIMTTASQVSLNGKAILDERELPADVFAIGAGHVNPSKANDPGLVFDIQPDDYIPYLCGLGYTTKQIKTIVKKTFSCFKSIPEAELNYPSFAVTLKRGGSKTYSRTVTNVGMKNSTYTIGSLSLPEGVHMVIDSPSQELRFTALHQKLTYKITFTRDIMDKLKGPYGQGYMTWVSDKYSVRTPFSFKFR
ncbi:subtilisin-like protease SBT1.2 [Cynara cardunculus var. scolymus]|uniref:subtilisin-like protease SBT1.2 n=1 Tax=Cynara cardunculus var. scolymus TaxID=59895 RepID=UPI000D62EA5D|nr:subtilisin-like protease SBT1.2 [Cynara cardunculus var. scolymus]